MNTKQLLLLILIFLLGFSCSFSGGEGFKNDKKSSRAKDHLQGKVKSLQHSVSVVRDGENIEDAVVDYRKEYTEYGMWLHAIYWNNEGSPVQELRWEYDSLNNCTLCLSEYFDASKSDLIKTVWKYDPDRFNRKGTMYENDSLVLVGHHQYDSLGNKICDKEYDIYGKLIKHKQFRYDKDCHLIYQKQMNYYKDSKEEYVHEWKYDNKGNLIGVISSEDRPGNTRKYNYREDGSLRWTKNYDSEGKLCLLREYDRYDNLLLNELYSDGKSTNQVRFKYRYDSRNNWIEKKKFAKDRSLKKPVLFEVEYREIKYY